MMWRLTALRHWLIRLLARGDNVAINLWIEGGGLRLGRPCALVHNVTIVGAKKGLTVDGVKNMTAACVTVIAQKGERDA